MLLRALTAVVLIAGLLAALFLLEAAAFAAFTVLPVSAGAYEWGKLCRLRPGLAALYAGACALLYGALLLVLHPLSAVDLPERVLFGVAALFWLAAVPGLLRRGLAGVPQPLLMLSGLLVLVPAGLAMAALPASLLLAALVLVWVSDTAAYLGGRSFGRRKLAPVISPGKTWEGLWSAVVAVLIYAIICIRLSPAFAGLPAAQWIAYLATAGLLCLSGVLGDLFESALKRQAGVKDSGSLLPGHGGVLDRIDSATAVLPLAAFLLQWVRLG